MARPLSHSLKLAIAALAWLLLNATGSAQDFKFPSSSTYGGKNITLSGKLLLPADVRSPPLVLLLHGCGGLTKPALQSLITHAKALNKADFAAFVLDSFTPRGVSGGWVCERESRLASAWGYRKRDVMDAIDFLSKSGLVSTTAVFLVGQSHGASLAAILAANGEIPEVRAIAAFYPWCGAVHPEPKRPVMVFAAELDEWTPPQECITRQAEKNGFTLHIYDGAHHSFDLPIALTKFKGKTVGGNREATQDSQMRMIGFFRSYVEN